MNPLLLFLQGLIALFDRVKALFKVSEEQELTEIKKKNDEEKKEVREGGRPK
jgi:hypothetical protein